MKYVALEELRSWPLIHGSVTLYENQEKISQHGLKVPGKNDGGLNTFLYDGALGRNNYIFLAPARLKGGYGVGQLILIDPKIVKKEGVRFALYDIGEVIDQINRFILYKFILKSSNIFSEWVIKPKILEDIIISESTKIQKDSNSSDFFHILKKKIFMSFEFKRYTEDYYMSENEFFNKIEQKSIELSYSMQMYLERDWKWPYSEEILIPQQVDPESIIRYLDARKWTNWEDILESELDERVNLFIANITR